MEFKSESPETTGKMDKKREDLKGKVLALKDLVDYQEGGIVSRTLYMEAPGTLTLFAFDAGQQLSEHTAPYDATVTILDGECEVWVAGRTYQMKEGETIIFPANAPHALSAITRFKMMLVMIRD